jgi:hypothetical protein
MKHYFIVSSIKYEINKILMKIVYNTLYFFLNVRMKLNKVIAMKLILVFRHSILKQNTPVLYNVDISLPTTGSVHEIITNYSGEN